jgi:hypothetical protein
VDTLSNKAKFTRRLRRIKTRARITSRGAATAFHTSLGCLLAQASEGDPVGLLEVAAFTENLYVLFGVPATFRDGDDVIEVEVLCGTAPNASSFVAYRHHEFHHLRYRRTFHALVVENTLYSFDLLPQLHEPVIAGIRQLLDQKNRLFLGCWFQKRRGDEEELVPEEHDSDPFFALEFEALRVGHTEWLIGLPGEDRVREENIEFQLPLIRPLANVKNHDRLGRIQLVAFEIREDSSHHWRQLAFYAVAIIKNAYLGNLHLDV